MTQLARRYGLIGYPISHSFSPGYFASKFEKEGINDARYDLYPLKEIGMFQELIGINGLNVTIPYKEAVIPYLDELSLEANEIGAVNTIKFIGGRKLGFNTDCYGFEYSLLPMLHSHEVQKALVLGLGGAAKAVIYVLRKLDIDIMTVSRSRGDFTYNQLSPAVISDCQLIVNTTPLGMAPKTSICPDIPYEAINENHILFDLIYNPEKTLFLQRG